MNETTQLPSTIEQGDGQNADRLLPLIYDELHRLAAKLTARKRPVETLQAAALVNEAYLRLAESAQTHSQHWESRGHFFAAAAETMRRILVENARRRRALRHGGGWHRVPLDSVQVADRETEGQLANETLAVDEALDRLAAEDPIKAELVRLRFFAGLSVEEAAGVLGISRATAERHWHHARAWLRDKLTQDGFRAPASRVAAVFRWARPPDRRIRGQRPGPPRNPQR
jgi:RNA polymerase sigma factor (TIGR02999 family)